MIRNSMLQRTVARSWKRAISSGRPPLAPMPRVLPPPRSAQPQGKLTRMWKSGNLLIYVGWMGLALLVLDRYLQHAERLEANEMIAAIVDETKQKRLQLYEEWGDKPLKFRCKLHEDYSMGGSHGLEGVEKNDVLEVLQEGVGPGGYYHLCRTTDKDGTIKSVGWYPISYLTKI